MPEKKSSPFDGQTVYVGLDVHKKSWSVTILVEDIHHKTSSWSADPVAVAKYLKKLFPGAQYRSVYEAGFSGFRWHRELIALGIDNIVVNPADIPTTDKEKQTKTDRVDSLKLAQALRAGLVRGIHVPTAEAVELRSLSRGRALLMRNLRRSKGRIRGLLHNYGVKVPEEFERRSWTLRFEAWLRSVELASRWGRSMLDFYVEDYRHNLDQIRSLNGVLAEAVRSVYGHLYDLLLSIPGVGPLTAASVLTEIHPMSRFRSARQLCSYVGLMPTTHSSGDKDRTGSLTRRNHRYLLTLLVESSWQAIRKDPAMMLYYRRHVGRVGGKKAIIKVARKLLSRIRWVLTHEQPYKLSVA